MRKARLGWGAENCGRANKTGVAVPYAQPNQAELALQRTFLASDTKPIFTTSRKTRFRNTPAFPQRLTEKTTI